MKSIFLENYLKYTLSTFSTNLPQFWGSQIPLIFVLSQQLLLQFKSTYKTGSITATLLLLLDHVVTYKQSTADYTLAEKCRALDKSNWRKLSV